MWILALAYTWRLPAIATPRCDRPSLDELHGDVRALAELWETRHPCEPLPKCDRVDRVATLRAELADTPGRERVIASARFGLAMYDARGTLLTSGDLSCDGWRDFDSAPRVRLTTRRVLDTGHTQLEVLGRSFAHCGETITHTIFDAKLGKLVTFDGGGVHGCGVGEWTTKVRVTVPHPGVIEWHSTERSHRLLPDSDKYGPWTVEQSRCTFTAGSDGRFTTACPQ